AGNSAGQAAVFLAPLVRRLTLIVRGNGLDTSMSRYLIDRIRMLENVDIRVQSEVTCLHGRPPGALEGVSVYDRATGKTSHLPVRHLFLFLGAEPNTGWLGGCLALDEKGYIRTGLLGAPGSSVPVSGASQLHLQTSLPRVFAIGDVRAGSIKRVASA